MLTCLFQRHVFVRQRDTMARGRSSGSGSASCGHQSPVWSRLPPRPAQPRRCSARSRASADTIRAARCSRRGCVLGAIDIGGVSGRDTLDPRVDRLGSCAAVSPDARVRPACRRHCRRGCAELCAIAARWPSRLTRPIVARATDITSPRPRLDSPAPRSSAGPRRCRRNHR